MEGQAISSDVITCKRYRTEQQASLVPVPTMWFPNRSDTNQDVQSQKQAGSLKFRIKKEEEVYYP